MRKILTSLLILFLALSCSPEGETKAKFNRGFRTYIQNNDVEKGLKTSLRDVEIISYTEVDEANRKSAEEKYEVQIYMSGKTAYSQGARVYNLDDTVACYFDESFKMLRLQHSTED